jgi:putative flippase GtrA
MSNLSLKLVSYLKTTSALAQKLEASSLVSSQFVKFLLVGIVNTAIGLSLILFLKNGLEWPYWLATFTGNTIGAAASFLLNRQFTFNSRVTMGQGGPRFAAVVLGSYLFAYSASHFLSTFFQQFPITEFSFSSENLAILIGSGLYTIINYLGQKFFVFNQSQA